MAPTAQAHSINLPQDPRASDAQIMAGQTNQNVASWYPGKSVQLDYASEAPTSKIALKTLFNLDDPGDRERFSGTLKLAFELMNVRLRRIFKLPLWVPTPANRRLQGAVGELDRTVEGFIASGRSRRDVAMTCFPGCWLPNTKMARG